MSRLFDDAASDRLLTTSTPVTAPPFTMAVWFNTDALQVQTVFGIVDSGGNADYWCVGINASNQAYLTIYDNGPIYAVSTKAYSINTWHHFCATITNDTTRQVYLDGGNPDPSPPVNNMSPDGADRIGIGVLARAALTGYFSGCIAEAAIWNMILSAREIAALGNKGFSPLLVRPESLVGYWPLLKSLRDKLGIYDLTAVGTVESEHCRVVYPASPLVFNHLAAGGNMAVLAQHYKKMRVA